MTERAISPLNMPQPNLDGPAASGRAARRSMTLASIPDPQTASMAFDITIVDATGRIFTRSIIGSLGWVPGQRLAIQAAAGLIIAVADPAGSRALTAHGNLTLPVGLRSLCGLETGVRVLLAADPRRRRLLVYPPGLLDQLLTQHHHDILGGDA